MKPAARSGVNGRKSCTLAAHDIAALFQSYDAATRLQPVRTSAAHHAIEHLFSEGLAFGRRKLVANQVVP
jgi:hypothetical protein